MPRPTPRDPKPQGLREHRSLNPHPQRVRDELFGTHEFFDSRDLVQVKYEMLRRVGVEHQSISHTADSFGFSRPSFYKAQADFEAAGLPGLVPNKPGPRKRHKLGPEVIEFVLETLAGEGSLPATELSRRVQARFGITVHPRSIQRALIRAGEKP